MRQQAILCVDDEVIILISLTQELKTHFGARFLYEQATDAAEALAIVEDLSAENVEIIFVISDWLMPGMKGDEFLEEIHKKHPDIKAIMITGHADETAIRRVQSNGSVVAVFNKPWDSKELIRTIEAHCGNNRGTTCIKNA
jgi:DNA-binding NtrC family response regulator